MTRERMVYTIPPEWPFVDALAAGIMARVGDRPAELAAVTVLLPTRRACRSLREAFLRVSGGRPVLLPKMTPLGDIDADELALSGESLSEPMAGQAGLEVAPAVSGLRRQLLLARLVMARGESGGETTPDQATALAAELARLLDQVHTERLSFAGLDGLVPEAYAEHWQQTILFLRILTEQWPLVLADEGALDPAERRNRVLEAQARVWDGAPPSAPVIAAGSTGSIPATADLLKTVAAMPEGAVVLPGLDCEASDDAWRNLGPHHPQYGMARLIERLGVERNEVEIWPAAGFEADPAGRSRLINHTLVPSAAGAEPVPAVADTALDGISRVDCPTPQDEAAVIALVMRQVLEEPGRTAALVTPDRLLARRVATELGRWQIDIDDSAGRPLAQTAPGVFLRLTARMAVDDLAPVALLAALKHPLAAAGMARSRFVGLVRALETGVLRGPRPGAGIDGLRAALGKDAADVEPVLTAVEAAMAEIGPLLEADSVSGADVVAAHLVMAEALAASDEDGGARRLWAGDAGEALYGFVAELMEAASALGDIDPASYPALLDSLMAGRPVRPKFGRHPRLHIWGLLEARLQRVDVMILGGLNEATWPPETEASPWMSRPMMKAFGLPLPERRIGLAAHDFTQTLAAPEVVMTRAERVDGTPTVPSRWLQRLDNMLERIGRKDALRPTRPWLDWIRQLDRPAASRRIEAPAPRPPLAARPTRLSVTQVETWIRDPYAVYARHVLGLQPLEPLDADPGAAERGSIVHAALDRFLRAHAGTLPDDAERRLVETGRRVFDEHLARPGVRAFWWPRFERIAGWFLDYERARREAGFRTVLAEVRGEMEIPGPAGPFVLSAKADRIDRRDDVGLVVIDYKTGAPPSDKQVKIGFAPQLTLEAAIAEAGGFPGLAAERVAGLLYIQLSGGRRPGREKPVKVDDIGEVVGDAVAGLSRLVGQYADSEMPYRSQHRPQFLNRYGEYDHLARVREWRTGGGDE